MSALVHQSTYSYIQTYLSYIHSFVVYFYFSAFSPPFSQSFSCVLFDWTVILWSALNQKWTLFGHIEISIDIHTHTHSYVCAGAYWNVRICAEKYNFFHFADFLPIFTYLYVFTNIFICVHKSATGFIY